MLVVQYGRTVDDVVTRLCTVDGMMRDIMLYGQDMRTAKATMEQTQYDGPGSTGGAALAIPDGLAVHVPYSPLDTRTTHKVLKDPAAAEIIGAITEMRPTVVVLHGGLSARGFRPDGSDMPGAEVLGRLPPPILEHRDNII